VVVNSAGCGAWLKECGVPALDISEAIGTLDLSAARWDGVVTYHEACHLVHGQKISAGPRSLIQSVPGVRFVELPEADVCCGSAGVYSMVEPEMAHRLRDRKWGHIERALSAPAGSRPPTVVLGNPGCHAWIADAAKRTGSPIQVLHLAEFLEFALVGARR
jgi:glycolate oxidase iron-sulfur subunit